MANLILSVVAISIFLIYNITVISIFGMPWSLSTTYYQLEGKKKNLGWLFSIMMWIVGFILLIPWINITNNISEWSHYLTFLPFLGAGSIIFVGAAPRFRPYKELENKIHTISAGIAAVASLIWVAVVCWKIMWIIPVWVLLIGGLAHATKKAKKCRDYWLEFVAFGSTFSAILIESILMVI